MSDTTTPSKHVVSWPPSNNNYTCELAKSRKWYRQWVKLHQECIKHHRRGIKVNESRIKYHMRMSVIDSVHLVDVGVEQREKDRHLGAIDWHDQCIDELSRYC